MCVMQIGVRRELPVRDAVWPVSLVSNHPKPAMIFFSWFKRCITAKPQIQFGAGWSLGFAGLKPDCAQDYCWGWGVLASVAMGAEAEAGLR
jgi:hypothetical protein